MAKAASKALGSKGKSAGGKKPSLIRNIGLLVAVVPLIFVFMPTVIFMGIALIPTLVALMVDKSARRYCGITVGALNFSGALPYLLDLWLKDHSVPHALTLLANVFNLMVILGASAFGWMLYVVTPLLVSGAMSFSSSNRTSNLKTKQQDLLAQWGPDVAKADDGADMMKKRRRPGADDDDE